jgi:hypothetical protein
MSIDEELNSLSRAVICFTRTSFFANLSKSGFWRSLICKYLIFLRVLTIFCEEKKVTVGWNVTNPTQDSS